MSRSIITDEHVPAPACYSTAQRMPTEADGTAGKTGYGSKFVSAYALRDCLWGPYSVKEINEHPEGYPAWMPMPAAPVAENTECEKAFEKHCEQRGDGNGQWLDFVAGYEADRKETR